jgi:ribonuclease D
MNCLTRCAGTDDIITLQRDFGLRFAALFETQTAAELCGIRR